MPYSIRAARPQDVPAIEEHCRLQNERDKTSYGVPEIFDESWRMSANIPLALVILHDGEIKQGVVVERTAELLLYGCDAKATAQLHKEIEGLFYVLRQKGYTGMHCFVPKQVALRVEKPLLDVGFKRDDFRLAHFWKDLTKIEEEETI